MKHLSAETFIREPARKTLFRLLVFRASREELIRLDGRHLALGLAMTWLAGVGRYWDAPKASLFDRLGLGSVAYVFGLSLFLWLVLAPLRPKNWNPLALLTFVTLTAPLAFIYAIPVEKFFAPDIAAKINMGFLGLVATWRVALLGFYLRRACEMGYFSMIVGTLFPLSLIVTALHVNNLALGVFNFMGGIRRPDDYSNSMVAALVKLSLKTVVPLAACYTLLAAVKIADSRV
jgi:uncharacterized membrane protein